jgi:uncharacterized protein YecE (DUF72 family)
MPGPSIHVGTSGWTYDNWTGPFYPEDVEGPERLSYYVKHFDTVEVNATFYRLPFEGMIKGWNKRLPESYHLVVKGPRVVTHVKRLKDCEEYMERFLKRVLSLRALRMILWQFPPSFPHDLDLLEEFLSGLPTEVRHAVEFRHERWWERRTTELLSRHKVAFVGVSHPRLPEELPCTTDFAYLRFHGRGKKLYDYDYSAGELRVWVEKVARLGEGCEVYAFFNNDWHANATKNAKTFRNMLHDPLFP